MRSAGTMLEYWNDPEHTAAVLQDGWLRTGDVGRIDEDGWYWFVSRSKELIIRGGSNVAPGEVEAVLHQHPAVAEAVVVGVPDAHLGQRIAAWVRCAGGSADAAELTAFVADRIAAYKVPEWLWIEPSLPTTSVGKFDRHLLQTRAVERTRLTRSHSGSGRLMAAVSAPAPASVHVAPSRLRVIFAGLMLVMLLAALDQTIVATALPTIVGDLGGLEPPLVGDERLPARADRGHADLRQARRPLRAQARPPERGGRCS